MILILQTGKEYDGSLIILEVFTMDARTQTLDQPRIQLSEGILKRFFKDILQGEVAELAAEKGLPYSLVYNLAHGRIRSLSAKDYRMIFGEEPLYQEPERVDGAYFREMVKLWLFLNHNITEADLYREFYPDKEFSRVDYRIFNGEVRSVETRLEKTMEEKFLNQGFDSSEIKAWIEELGLIYDEERVPYQEIKPVLEYLEQALGVSPTRVLNQAYARYESGELRTVSKKAYDYALELRKRAEEVLHSDSKFEIEKLREEIYGKRDGLVLYGEIEGELRFLQKYGGKGPRQYLGRSISKYEKSILKRIASWRAQRIRDGCSELVNTRPEIPLLFLPRPHLEVRLTRLLSVLRSHLIRRMIGKEGETYEKFVLMPLSPEKEEYGIEKHEFVSMDKAAYALEMSTREFDLMVARNKDIVRRIGSYDGKWSLPALYLKELSEKKGFYFVKAKYELLAKIRKRSPQSREGTARGAHVPKQNPWHHRISQSHSDTPRFGS